MNKQDIIYINNFCKDPKYNSYQLHFIEDINLKNFIDKVSSYVLKNDFNNQIKKISKYIQDTMLTVPYNINGLINFFNSCYIDSVLLALFGTKNYFIKKFLLKSELKERQTNNLICNLYDQQEDLILRKKIQKNLKDIYKRIHNNKEYHDDFTCYNLRYLLRNCKEGKRYFTTDQQDVDEFLRFLLSIFDTNVAETEQIMYYYNTPDDKILVEHIKKNNDTIIIPIEYNDLINNRLILFNDSLTKKLVDEPDEEIKKDDKKYKYRNYIYKYIDSPYLIFTIPRKQINRIVKTPVELTRILDNKYLLISIVVFTGNIYAGHYTTYFLYNGEWLYYDDLDNFKQIGNFEELSRSIPSPITNGVQYYYIKIN